MLRLFVAPEWSVKGGPLNDYASVHGALPRHAREGPGRAWIVLLGEVREVFIVRPPTGSETQRSRSRKTTHDGIDLHDDDVTAFCRRIR